MTTLFIADLHLRKEDQSIITGFLHFLRREAFSADALYILGDLFEFWIGDDDPNPLYRKTINSIKELVDSNVPCYFIHGNRDFLIGKRFSVESGVILLPEEQILNLYGRKMLIMHGDALCTDDIKYQAFRKRIRRPLIKQLFLSTPLFVRNYVVGKIRSRSKVNNLKKIPSIMDVNPKTVIEIMEKYQVQWLIYGHTHRPNIHKFTANGQSAFRITLGEWKDNKGSVVKVTPKSVKLLHFPLY